MNTSNYILELLISGICTIFWIAVLSFSIWGDVIMFQTGAIGETNKLILALGLAPIVYVIGVINDRVVDSVFDKFVYLNLRTKYFPEDEEYKKARSKVYINSDTLTNLFEYGRMRIRICRNWTLNGLLILISILIFIWSKFSVISDFSTKIEISIGFSVLMIVSIISSYYAWKRLNEKEFEFLQIQSKILDEMNA